MNPEQSAYLNLIHQLLTCPNGEEAEVLNSHPELLDDGLVAAMLEEADNLREKGELDNANRLKNWAGILRKVDGDFLAVIERKAEADKLKTQGNKQSEISQYREALQSYEQALTIYREIGDRAGEANSLNGLGIAYKSLGKYKGAIDIHQQSLAIERQIGNRQGEANSLGALGNAYQSLGQYNRAINLHQAALTIYREIGNRAGEANSLGSLGNTYDSLGMYNRAIDFYEQYLEISREIEDPVGEANSLGGLGNAYQSLGEYNRAIDFHEQSLVIQREIGNRAGETHSLGNLGLVYDSLENYNRAIDFYEQYLEISRKIGNRQGEANSLGSLGNAYYSLGRYNRALDFHEQSLVIQRAIGNRQGEAISLGNLGNTYYSLGQLDRAIEFQQKSLEISREIGDLLEIAKLLASRGNAEYLLGKYQQAFDFYRQYLEISQEIGNFITNYCFPQNTEDNLLKYHQLKAAEITLNDLIHIHENVLSKLVNDDYKILIFETQVSTYLLLQKILVTNAKFENALEISEMGRTRILVELLRQTLLANDLPANDETNTLSIPKIKQIAKQKNSTIVEYSIVYSDIYIWVIQTNGNIIHRAANLQPLNQQNQSLKQIILKARVSIGVDEIDEEGNKIQGKLKYQPDMEGGYPLLKILYQILIEPIADLLPTDPNSPIVFIPHYELFLVPFTALQSANNRYLIEDYTILTAPSIQVLEQTSQHQQNIKGLRQAALIVGDPTIAAKFQENPYNLPQLPRAKEAAEAIAAILGTTAISGENATKVAILDQMLNTRIVHLSAHGLLDDFQGSGIPGTIILAASGDTDDGALNAVEILQLKLNSELVVLSACSTGGGTITGDGVNGLSRCFILAGVPSIIVSLWNMGVISAKLLMTEFYQNLALGDNKAAALRCAMLTTKERFPSPIAWAAFTLIGETESLPLETQKIDLRRLKMPLPDNYTSEEIVAGLAKLLKTSEPKLFVNDLAALDVESTDNVNISAEKIRVWCETRSQIEENLENEIEQAGPCGTDGDAPEEVVRELMEVLMDNKMRLGLSRPSVPVDETDDSGTESVDNPT